MHPFKEPIKKFVYAPFFAFLCLPFGTVAERLGKALQKLLQQFESARYLKSLTIMWGFFIFKLINYSFQKEAFILQS